MKSPQKYLLCLLMFPTIGYGWEKPAMKDEIPTVAFCEMVKTPTTYFDKTIRVTAFYTQAAEGRYLNDDENCPLSPDDQIGAEFSESETSDIIKFDEITRQISSAAFDQRAKVTIIGKLRDISVRGFSRYRYRFDIISFESVSPILNEYRQNLETSVTYHAEVQKDISFRLNFVIPYRPPAHHAYSIEWTNLKKFPALREAKKHQIVFTVLSKEIKQMTGNRWNQTIRCEIIRVE